MKNLLLVRHAKSSWDNPYQDDFDRPLNNRGDRDAPEMAHRLVTRGEKPQSLVSSPANRAMKTASIFAEAFQIDKDKIIQEGKIYEASVNDLLSVIRHLPDAQDKVMLFGHNPGFTALANHLSNARIDNMPTCCIVSINFKVDSWQDIKEGGGKLVYIDYPKKKRS